MGSSGTSSFSDYPGSRGGSRASGEGAGGGGAGEGGDVCERPFQTHLEEVATCDYYRNNGAVPSDSTTVSIRNTLVSGRIGIQTSNGVLIGYLPTSFNYVLQCINRGFSFTGKVTNADERPTPSVHVSLSGSV